MFGAYEALKPHHCLKVYKITHTRVSCVLWFLHPIALYTNTHTVLHFILLHQSDQSPHPHEMVHFYNTQSLRVIQITDIPHHVNSGCSCQTIVRHKHGNLLPLKVKWK